MTEAEAGSRHEVGNLALARFAGVPASILRRTTYVAATREREVVGTEGGVQRIERTVGLVYRPAEEDGLLGHVAFAMKHETVHLGLLAVVFDKLETEVVARYVSASPTGAYARRIGYLYELLTGRDLLPLLKDAAAIGGNYAPVLDPERMVTGAPRRVARWKVDDNLLGDRRYSPTIERTAAAQAALSRDWKAAVAGAVADGHPELLRRALQYLYHRETKSSFQIERETPSQERAKRFIAALERAGAETIETALSEANLVRLQNIIVDPRYAAAGFRTNQNYVGATVRWEPVIHYVSPPPGLVPELMAGLADAAARLGGAEPLAQTALAAFGFVFHHPFEDGNGRIHRYLIHDILVRRKIVPGRMALPVSAAILEDMGGYEQALETYSKLIEKVAVYTLSPSGEMTVTNPKDAAWIWRYPDLTPQVEYLGRAMGRAVEMVPEELDFLARYDELLGRAKEIVDMPDMRLSDLLTQIHTNGGTLSNNKRKQRFRELTDGEVKGLEGAYAEVFGGAAPKNNEAPGTDLHLSPTPGKAE